MAGPVAAEFFAIMTPASEGVEAAVRCYVKHDFAGALRHLKAAQRGIDLIQRWIDEDVTEVAANG